MLCNNIRCKVSSFFEHILINLFQSVVFILYIDDFGRAIVHHCHGDTGSNAHILYILSVINVIILKRKCFAL